MLKASAGSSEHIPFLSVANPSTFLDNASANGWKLYAAVAPPTGGLKASKPQSKYLSADALQSPLREHPCVLLMGGEGEGLRWNLRKMVQYEVGIAGARRGQSDVDSLNVSVAAGILCQAFLRMDSDDKTSSPLKEVAPTKSLF